jgi:HD superfamily phosphodiesterase
MIIDRALEWLEKELPVLPYHGLHHTIDVWRVARRLAKEEGLSEEEVFLVELAALFHDSGFIIHPDGHEARGCEVARQILPGLGVSDDQISIICTLIMGTVIPQKPEGKMGAVLCDADLDYLGRDDFYEIGNTLFQEMQASGKVSDIQSFNHIQVRFLENHKYHTAFSIKHREPVKQKHLEQLKQIVERDK